MERVVVGNPCFRRLWRVEEGIFADMPSQTRVVHSEYIYFIVYIQRERLKSAGMDPNPIHLHIKGHLLFHVIPPGIAPAFSFAYIFRFSNRTCSIRTLWEGSSDYWRLHKLYYLNSSLNINENRY